MFPRVVRFLSDEGDAHGIDLDLLGEWRSLIEEAILSGGSGDATTIKGGFLTVQDIGLDEYIAISWYFEDDETAVVFALAPGTEEIEEPPPA